MPEKLPTPLKKLRESREITQREVAEAVGIDQSTYHKIEAGIHSPRPETATALVKYFGSALNELHLFFPDRYSDYEVSKR